MGEGCSPQSGSLQPWSHQFCQPLGGFWVSGKALVLAEAANNARPLRPALALLPVPLWGLHTGVTADSGRWWVWPPTSYLVEPKWRHPGGSRARVLSSPNNATNTCLPHTQAEGCGNLLSESVSTDPPLVLSCSIYPIPSYTRLKGATTGKPLYSADGPFQKC